MATWKIHLVWGVATLVAAAAWGQQVASRKDREFERERGGGRLQRSGAKVAQATATAPEAAPPTAPDHGLSDRPTAGDAEPTLSKPGKAPTAEALSSDQIRVLLQSKDRGDVQRGVRAIEKLQDRAAKLALLKECLAHPEEDARRRALDLLRKMGGPEAASLIAQALLSDPDENVRERAARHLGEVGGPAALTALQQAARSGTMDVQVASAVSLDKLGDSGATQALLPRIGGMLESPDGAVREDAVGYLDDLRTPGALHLLSQALRDSNSDIRRDAVEALEDLAIPEVLPLLEQAASDPHPAVVREARRALEKLQNPVPKK